MTPTASPPDLLEAIVAATAREVDLRRARITDATLSREADQHTPRGDAFQAALSDPSRVNVIAECKRRSPSRGILREPYDPAVIARTYADAGAAAISVLTEPAFFDGSLDHLRRVRSTVDTPLLRKDFIVSSYQVTEARAAGADAILLIVAALDDRQLAQLHEEARQQGLAALVEVHDATELARATDAGAMIVGVNNRNLRTLEVDLSASHALIARMPRDVVAVAESGISTPESLDGLRQAGYSAFLVGEALMMSDDPGETLRGLLSAGTTTEDER